MAGVSIIGKQAILDTYTDCGYEVFALFQGKQLLVVGSGIDELETWIDRFCPPGMSAGFTLRLYDCLEETVRITTDYAASFPCRAGESYGGIGGFSSTLTKRIEALEKGGKDEKEDKFTDAVMGWLDEPEKLLQVVGAIKALFSPAESVAAMPAAMGAVIPKEPAPGKLTADQERRYIELAGYLDILEKHDPDIVSHLGKLAGIAQNEPSTFKMLLGMLKNK